MRWCHSACGSVGSFVGPLLWISAVDLVRIFQYYLPNSGDDKFYLNYGQGSHGAIPSYLFALLADWEHYKPETLGAINSPLLCIVCLKPRRCSGNRVRSAQNSEQLTSLFYCGNHQHAPSAQMNFNSLLTFLVQFVKFGLFLELVGKKIMVLLQIISLAVSTLPSKERW